MKLTRTPGGHYLVNKGRKLYGFVKEGAHKWGVYKVTGDPKVEDFLFNAKTLAECKERLGRC